MRDSSKFRVRNPDGSIHCKTRADLEVNDEVMSPSGKFQKILERKEAGPELHKIIFEPNSFTVEELLFGSGQKLYLTAPELPRRHFDANHNSIVICWVHRNLMRSEVVPLDRIVHANAIWSAVNKGSTEHLSLPFEIYNSLPYEKRKLLRLVMSKDRDALPVPFTTHFGGYGSHWTFKVAGDGLFISEDDIIFVE